MIRAFFSSCLLLPAKFFCSKLGLSFLCIFIKKRTRRNDDEEEYHQYHHHQDFEDDEVDDGGRERRGDDDDAKDIIIEIIEIIVIIFNGIDDGRVLESNRRRGDPVVLAGRARVANRKGVLPAPGR